MLRAALSLQRGRMFTSQLALVTGASRGIGRAIAKHFAAGGARVVLMARSAADLESAAGELAAVDGGHICAPCDVCDANQVESALSSLRKDRVVVNHLVHCAGTACQRRPPPG